MGPLRVRALLPALLLAASCGRGGAAPDYLHLARLDAELVRGAAPTDPSGARLVEDADGTWLQLEIPRAAWRYDERRGVWATPEHGAGRGRPDSGDPQRLDADGLAIPWCRAKAFFTERCGTPAFTEGEGELLLRLPAGESPPEVARLRVYCERELRSGDARRVRGSRHSGEGIALWPGERRAWSVDLPPDSALRLATAVEPALAGPARTPVFRAELDGVTLFEHPLTADRQRAEWHEIALPPGGSPRARLELSVDGGLAHAAFLAPVVGPADPGAPGDRPWEEPRSDVVLFVADTFRADLMEAYGGELGLTPFLDELARDSLVLTDVHSVSTYTLPAHATMFTGVYPNEMRISGTGFAIPRERTTIAERFARAGYRTAAITDSIQVSQRFAVDQGFEWFDENASDLEATLQRARDVLDMDDGRPLFLFVHTYRVHVPYRVSEETLALHGERLGIEGREDELRARLERAVRAFQARPGSRAALDEVLGLVDRLRAHYRGGAIDLDRGLRRFVGDLEDRGLLERGHLVFTSDHGEGFFEHGSLYHTDVVWDEVLRVPLLVTGGGVEPGTVDWPASLVDLAPTLADLAGLPDDPDWLGTSLLELEGSRDLFAFECHHHTRPESTLAVLSGGKKVIGLEDPERLEEGLLLGAFDLERDPGEREDRRDEAWAAELWERALPALRRHLAPLGQGSRADLGAKEIEELRAMGYLDETSGSKEEE